MIGNLQLHLPALAIVYFKIILRELLGPADLFGAQTLHIRKTTEVIMVHKDENLMLAVFQIMTPRLKGFDNSQKLIVVGFVSSLCRNHFPKKKHYWVLLA